jgi:hypothetical protein
MVSLSKDLDLIVTLSLAKERHFDTLNFEYILKRIFKSSSTLAVKTLTQAFVFILRFRSQCEFGIRRGRY